MVLQEIHAKATGGTEDSDVMASLLSRTPCCWICQPARAKPSDIAEAEPPQMSLIVGELHSVLSSVIPAGTAQGVDVSTIIVGELHSALSSVIPAGAAQGVDVSTRRSGLRSNCARCSGPRG